MESESKKSIFVLLKERQNRIAAYYILMVFSFFLPWLYIVADDPWYDAIPYRFFDLPYYYFHYFIFSIEVAPEAYNVVDIMNILGVVTIITATLIVKSIYDSNKSGEQMDFNLKNPVFIMNAAYALAIILCFYRVIGRYYGDSGFFILWVYSLAESRSRGDSAWGAIGIGYGFWLFHISFLLTVIERWMGSRKGPKPSSSTEADNVFQVVDQTSAGEPPGSA